MAFAQHIYKRHKERVPLGISPLVQFCQCILFVVMILAAVAQQLCAQTRIMPTAAQTSTLATVLAFLSLEPLRQESSFQQTLPESNIFTIPFRTMGKLMVVQAKVNGIEGYFIVDSGAPFLVLNAKYFPHLGSPLRFMKVKGVTGDVGDVRTAVVNSFEWGGIRAQSLNCHVVDLSHLERRPTDSIFGLIGFEVFRELEMLMDYDDNRIVLYKLDSENNRIEYDADYQVPEYIVPFSYKGHVPIVEATIAQKLLRFGIDTGAEFNLLSNTLDSTVLQAFVRDKKIPLRGSGKSILEAWLGRVEDMRLGKASYVSQTTLLTDIRETNETFDVKLDGLLGQPFLRYRRTVINFRKKELHLWDFSY
jgi:hypothetical protein